MAAEPPVMASLNVYSIWTGESRGAVRTVWLRSFGRAMGVPAKGGPGRLRARGGRIIGSRRGYDSLDHLGGDPAVGVVGDEPEAVHAAFDQHVGEVGRGPG